jgi:hypothetical protein
MLGVSPIINSNFSGRYRYLNEWIYCLILEVGFENRRGDVLFLHPMGLIDRSKYAVLIEEKNTLIS